MEQHGIGQDQEVAPDLFHQPADDEAVEHAIGMVGDDDERPFGGKAREALAVIAHVELELSHRGGKKALAGDGVAPILEIEPLQPGLAGHRLDGADQGALRQGKGRVGIGELDVGHAQRL